MSTAWQRLAQDEHWRKSEFVISFPNEDSRSHLTYVTGVLHRSTCGRLSEKRRWSVYRPADVEATTLRKFRRRIEDRQGEYRYDVCRTCCRDIVVLKESSAIYHEATAMPTPPPRTEPTEAVLVQWIRDALMEKAWRHRRRISVRPEASPKRKAVTKMRVSFDMLDRITKDVVLTVEFVPAEQSLPGEVDIATAIEKAMRPRAGH